MAFTNGHSARRSARMLVLLMAVACAAGASAAYRAADQPRASLGMTKADAGRTPRATGSMALEHRKSVRVADATDTWLQNLLDPGFWRKGRSQPERTHRDTHPSERVYRHRQSRGSQEEPSERVRPRYARPDRARIGDATTYRTMCVRLCDGYFWPVSFTATKGEFVRDSEICQRSCDSPVALHVYRNPGEEPQDMIDLKGQPYAKLVTAFRYRTVYDASCKCRPHPWEDASRERHMSYARSGELHATAGRSP